MIDNIVAFLTNKLNDFNSKGIPLPTIRDPKTGLGSVSLTLVFISFNVVVAGLIGKITNLLGNVDLTNAIWLFGISCSLYFGRRINGNGKDITLEKDQNGS
jgi:hypothetical protein